MRMIMVFDTHRKITGPEDIRAIEQLAFEDVVTASTTYDAIRLAAAAHPERPAVTFLPTGSLAEPPVRWTYSELLVRVTQAANLFTDLGVGANDTVSLLLPSLPETQVALWGAEAAGIANPVNFLLRSPQIVELLKAAETRVLVALGPDPASDIWEKVGGLRDQVPTLQRVLRVGGETGGADFASLLASYPGDRLLSGRRIAGSDVAAYFHTGGTTGSPKLACHTHQNQVYSAWGVARMYDLGPESVLGNGLPMFHVAGTIIASLAPILGQSEIVLLSPAGLRNPRVIENYWRLVEKYRLTHIGGVPTSLAALLNVPVGGADLSSVEVTMTGASPLPLDTARRFESHSGARIHEIYGMTESAGLIAMAPRHRERTLGSVGYRMPFERVKVARIGAGGKLGEELVPDPGGPGGKSGEGMLLASGPNVFPGYKDSTQNGDALTEDGWLITGDLARIDAEGRIYVTGRAKDLIIRSGHNIDPAIVEEAIERHPDVELCAAIGQPDAYAVEVPVVYVTLRPGATASQAELETFVAEGIAEPPARPRHVYVVEELPVTAVGKIFKPDLRRDAVRRVVESELANIAGADGGLEVEVVASPAGGFEARILCRTSNGEDRAAIERQVAAKLGGYLFTYAVCDAA